LDANVLAYCGRLAGGDGKDLTHGGDGDHPLEAIAGQDDDPGLDELIALKCHPILNLPLFLSPTLYTRNSYNSNETLQIIRESFLRLIEQ